MDFGAMMFMTDYSISAADLARIVRRIAEKSRQRPSPRAAALEDVLDGAPEETDSGTPRGQVAGLIAISRRDVHIDDDRSQSAELEEHARLEEVPRCDPRSIERADEPRVDRGETVGRIEDRPVTARSLREERQRARGFAFGRIRCRYGR